jgi:hypothetical protein
MNPQGVPTQPQERHRARYVWSPDLDELLIAAYTGKGEKWRAFREIEKRTSWPRHAIWNRARELGLCRNRPAPARPWTKDEVEFLFTFTGTMPVAEMAEALGRTSVSVRSKLRALHYPARYLDGYAITDLMRDLRVGYRKVRMWISNGWLDTRGRRITDDSYVKFCREHASEIDFARLSQDIQDWLVNAMQYGRNDGVVAPHPIGTGPKRKAVLGARPISDSESPDEGGDDVEP